ncbi:MAG TPA: hypothetical protein VF118_00115 [Gemmatimonadaceae bacterium]
MARFHPVATAVTLSTRALSGVLLLLVAGCGSGNALMARFTPADADARARTYLGLFVRNQPDSAADRILPTLRSADAMTQLHKIADILRDQRFDTTRVVGVQTNTMNGIRHVNLSYELHSSSGWLLTNVATVDSARTWFVEGVSARPLSRSLEVDTHFTLVGRSAVYYVWLLLVGIAVLTSLGTAVFVVSRRGMPKRWVWALVALIGVGAFSLNWQTGAINVNPLNIQLASGAAVRAGPAAPWILTFAIPIGAFFAIRQYRRWLSTRGATIVDPPLAL